MTFSPYFSRRDPQHVRVLCTEHAGEYAAKGWEPGFGTLGRCELPSPPFCAACAEISRSAPPVLDSGYTTMTYQAANGEWVWVLLQGRTMIDTGCVVGTEAEAEAQAAAVLASFINDPDLTPVSINHGVDFERAKECLQAEAGRLFRAYREAQQIDPVETAKARAAYIAAQERADSLRLHDFTEIRAILGE